MLHIQRVRPPKKIHRWKGRKPTLKMGMVPTCRVHHEDLEAYLSKVFRMQGYDIQSETGAYGEMVPEFMVDGIIESTGTIQQQVDCIRTGRRTRRLGLILNVLCMDGFIPAGIYQIDMSQRCTPIESYLKALSKNYNPLDPECVRIKVTNKKDRKFLKRVKLLDQKAIAYKKENSI